MGSDRGAEAWALDLYLATFTALLAPRVDLAEHAARRRFFYRLGAETVGGRPLPPPGRESVPVRDHPTKRAVSLYGEKQYLNVECERSLGELIRQVLHERIDGR